MRTHSCFASCQLGCFVKCLANCFALTEATKILKERALKEIQAVELPTAIYSVIAAVIAGFLIGKFL